MDALLADYQTGTAQDAETQTQAAIAGALLAYRTGPDQDVFTTNQITSDQDTATALSIAAALLSYYAAAQVDGLLAGKLRFTEAAFALQIADEVVAAIGEQILGPTDVSLSNWTVRPSSGTAGAVSVDGYTLTLAVNPWNIVRPGAPLRLPAPARHGLSSKERLLIAPY